MTDFTDGLPDAPLVELVAKPVKREASEIIRDVAMEIVDDTTRVLDDALAFADIMPDEAVPPKEWVEKYGYERAHQRLRTAKYALMNAKEAPVGLKIAAQLGASIIKSKANEPTVNNVLHVEKIYINAPAQAYPELELDE